MKKLLTTALLLRLLHPLSASATGNQLDYPHSTTNNVKCAECHYTASLTLLDPGWTNDPPAHIDDLPFNNFCWNCHDGSAAQAVETHSSRTTSDKYGNWNIECRTCHWPHHIMQYREYGAESFEASGTSIAVTSTTLTVGGTPWTVDQFKGYILMPDTAKETFNYKILSNTENKITVTGVMDINEITAGSAFGIIYGNLLKATISTPNSGDKQVKFFRNQGANSFADGDAVYNGPCEVCHTQTNHFRNNGTGPEQNHENIGGKEGSNCVGICHSHANGFAHGQGSGGVLGCVQCHGHEAGTAIDSDMQSPYEPDEPAILSQGRGTTKSHSTHTEIDDDDDKGPAIYCDDCHDIANIPYFKAGVDGDGDGKINLAETTVCDPCHTPGGMVDGVNDAAVGVKNNWRNGIYESDSVTLAAGKELWCISCHDEVPSNSKPDGSGILAPNKAGDGSTWGYYETGHGNDGPYNATLHGNDGPAYVCTVCHDADAPHFNHAVGETRLRTITDDGLAYTANVSEVCLDCHKVDQTVPGELGFDSIAEATVHSGGVTDAYNTNASAVFPSYGDAADYGANPGYQCDACHEVHGTTKLAMVIETIDGNVGGASNPRAVQGFDASDTDMVDLDPTAAANDGVCDLCHAVGNDPHPDTNHPANHNLANSDDGCVRCHNHRDSFRHGGGAIGIGCGSDTECHGLQKAHPTHVGPNVGIGCDGCHDANDFPNFKSGVDGNGDGKFNLAETTACDECHTSEGAAIAKDNFATLGGWAATLGEKSYCGSCHDNTPGSYGGAAAPDIIGDDANYGFFVTGHGRTAGNYPNLLWQPTSETGIGNPPAGRVCSECHDKDASHFASINFRLKPGWENDAANSNCYQCHDENSSNYAASNEPYYFTNIAQYNNSAHGVAIGNVKCTDCHDVHGLATDINGKGLPAMTKFGFAEELCYECHKDPMSGGIENIAISGAGLADDIEEAFSFPEQNQHTMGASFTIDFARGAHNNGFDDQLVLEDADRSWEVNELVGKTILNRSDGYSSGIIAANTATTITVVLSGGIENDWDNGDAYTIEGPRYALRCTSCHNVHLITGKYWNAASNQTPITRFPPDKTEINQQTGLPEYVNLQPWGDAPEEKMEDYAGLAPTPGTYRTPTDDPFSGAQLPDYASYCLDCHQPMPDPADEQGAHGNLDYGNIIFGEPGDANALDAHGLYSANSPWAGGVCPDWYGCGKGEKWDADDCVGTEEECWPVLARGRGDQLFSKGGYSHEDRIAGANFVLSCTDCHEAHGSSMRSLIRPTVNGKLMDDYNGAATWNSLCDSCHFYNSDWHAGMSCVGCHGTSQRMGATNTWSLHKMFKGYEGTRTSSTRTFDQSLVLNLKLDGNLNDSGDWRMSGGWSRWTDATGAEEPPVDPEHDLAQPIPVAGVFSAGRYGQGLEVNNTPFEVGTTRKTRKYYEDTDGNPQTPKEWVGWSMGQWSTNEGYHGTWKYTDMKYNMTLEAWINPSTDDGERKILAKHTLGNGGYALTLRKFDGTLRVGLTTLVDPYDADCGGMRGAYSSVSIPLNAWTHVAATYDADILEDRDPNDGSVGRIRIYVNGDDVTDSSPDPASCYAQPGIGETAMWPNSDWNDVDPSVCYLGSWCASALSIGGMNWSDPNNNFIGKLDEVKIYNVTQPYDNPGVDGHDPTHFEDIDAAVGPYIALAEATVGSNQLMVYFSEGAYGDLGGSLDPGDFNLNNSEGRVISNVVHSAGDDFATLTMSGAMDPNDYLTDTLAPAANKIFDEHGAASDSTTEVLVKMITSCPTDPVSIQLNETAGSVFVNDDQSALFGEVFGTGTIGGGVFSGDGVGNHIMFDDNHTCLQASAALTIETMIKPTGIPSSITGTTNYIKRIFDRVGTANYQISVWSVWNDSNWPNFNPPAGTASIAFWAKPVDSHGMNDWKPVLADYSVCPIVDDHWYKVRAVWNTYRPGGTPGAEFVPADIFIDDLGTLGDDGDENWLGYKNCTDRAQLLSESTYHLYESDVISASDDPFSIGANANNPSNNVFIGEIDWITWKATADYSGTEGL